MNIKAEILREHSKPQALKIAAYIGPNKQRFARLMHLFFEDEYRITQRAAWIVSHCADKYPELINPYIKKLFQNIDEKISIAVKRNTVRVLQFVDIPDELLGLAADKCFEMLESKNEPIAVKVFSMTILGNICESVPELASELTLIIEDQLPYGSAGFRSRGNRILKKLKKLNSSN